jgi:hypothetical protein
MKKSKGTKWDGKSRVSNDEYRKNYDEIFKKKSRNEKKLEHINLKEKYASLEPDPFKVEVKQEPGSEEELEKIIDRNGF